jgi:hypothetical protein
MENGLSSLLHGQCHMMQSAWHWTDHMAPWGGWEHAALFRLAKNDHVCPVWYVTFCMWQD